MARFVTIDIPPSHQGVGQALRSVFRPEKNKLPADMTVLLGKLDTP